jgi:hypothetical protein
MIRRCGTTFSRRRSIGTDDQGRTVGISNRHDRYIIVVDDTVQDRPDKHVGLLSHARPTEFSVVKCCDNQGKMRAKSLGLFRLKVTW